MEAASQRSWRVRFNGRAGEFILAKPNQTASGAPIVITQNDVRSVQLAKAALYAGVKLLMGRRGVDSVDQVLLAGAFGSFISPQHAMVLGLIPDCDLDKVTAVGKAAGGGAPIALLNNERRVPAEAFDREVEFVFLVSLPPVQEEFRCSIGARPSCDPFLR